MASRRRRRVPQLALWVGLLLLGSSVAEAANECAAWPGEPDPLPTLGDADPVRARWAELRVAELTQRARSLEGTAIVESYLLWRRVLCLSPGSLEARLGAARMQPIRIHRPAVISTQPGPLPELAEVAPGDDPWVILAAPVALSPAPAGDDEDERAAQRERILADIEARLGEADALLRQAQFEAALAEARDVRARLDRMRRGPDLRALRVRLELLAATAQIALGDDEGASESLVRAVGLQPDLALDPRHTSPKVMRALEAARAVAEARP